VEEPAIVPAPAEAEPTVVTYKDDDLVYVDPDTRTVVGFVEWSNNGRPKPLLMKKDEPVIIPELKEAVEPAKPVAATPTEKGKPARRPAPPRRLRYYPWGTYRSMKRVYKIEGKQIKEESNKTLDEVIEKALTQPFWD